MSQSISSSKIKIYSLMILVALFITCTISIIHSKPVYASGNYTNLNGNTDNGQGTKVGEIYWGGSTSRTGLLFFVVDNNTHKVKEYKGNKIAFRVFKDQEQQYTYTQCMAKIFKNHFGEDLTQINEVIEADMPYPVVWHDDTNKWSGNSGAIDGWLFSKDVYNGLEMEKWQILILKGYGNKLGAEILKDLQTNQDITLAVEPIAWNCIYKGDVWGDKPANADSNPYDKADYYDAGYYGSGAYKPLLYGEVAADDDGYIKGTGTTKDMLGEKADHIFRYASTGMYSATYANMMAGGAIPNGGVNWKWTNEALGYCMTLREEQLGIAPINEAPKRQPCSTFANESLSFALAMFNAELKVNRLDTYAKDVTPNPSTPYQAETPTPEKNTVGNCHIVKLYYDINHKSSTTFTTECVGMFETDNTTEYIHINKTDELENTYYRLKKWSTTNSKKVNSKEDFYTSEDMKFDEGKWDKLIRNPAIRNGSSEDKDIDLDINNPDINKKETYLYLLYVKDVYPPEPDYKEYNWEIPESYLTRSAYFDV